MTTGKERVKYHSGTDGAASDARVPPWAPHGVVQKSTCARCAATYDSWEGRWRRRARRVLYGRSGVSERRHGRAALRMLAPPTYQCAQGSTFHLLDLNYVMARVSKKRSNRFFRRHSQRLKSCMIYFLFHLVVPLLFADVVRRFDSSRRAWICLRTYGSDLVHVFVLCWGSEALLRETSVQAGDYGRREGSDN